MIMNSEQLMSMTADDRVAYLRGRMPDYDDRINQALESVITEGSSNSRIRNAFKGRVENNLCQPGGRFGGNALEHLAQGWPTSTITQGEYNRLNAAATGLAASILMECGFEKQAQPAVKKYGRLRIELDF